MDNTVNINVPNEDLIVEVTTKKKRPKEHYPGYTMVGNGRETRRGGKSMDMFEVCKKLGTAEMNLLQFFKDEIDANKIVKEENPNIVVPTKSENCTDYIKRSLKKHYAHMECLQIIRRVKRGTYIVNPMLFIPPKDYQKILAVWNSVSDKGCDDAE